MTADNILCKFNGHSLTDNKLQYLSGINICKFCINISMLLLIHSCIRVGRDNSNVEEIFTLKNNF